MTVLLELFSVAMTVLLELFNCVKIGAMCVCIPGPLLHESVQICDYLTFTSHVNLSNIQSVTYKKNTLGSSFHCYFGVRACSIHSQFLKPAFGLKNSMNHACICL